jgi:hypothetical protein
MFSYGSSDQLNVPDLLSAQIPYNVDVFFGDQIICLVTRLRKMFGAMTLLIRYVVKSTNYEDPCNFLHLPLPSYVSDVKITVTLADCVSMAMQNVMQ